MGISREIAATNHLSQWTKHPQSQFEVVAGYLYVFPTPPSPFFLLADTMRQVAGRRCIQERWAIPYDAQRLASVLTLSAYSRACFCRGPGKSILNL